VKIKGVVIQRSDGTEETLPLSEAKALYKQLADIFETKAYPVHVPVAVEPRVYPRPPNHPDIWCGSFPGSVMLEG
jgi:hypothetical protein